MGASMTLEIRHLPPHGDLSLFLFKAKSKSLAFCLGNFVAFIIALISGNEFR